MAIGRRPLVGLLYSSAAPEVLDACPGTVELHGLIPERLFYDCGPGRGNRFHWVEGALTQLESYVDGTTVAAHGIGLSLPSDMPLDEALLDVIAGVHDRLGFAWYSEHLSSFATMRSAVPNAQAGLGLPVPYDEPVRQLVAEKVDRLRDRLGVRVLLENPAVFTPVPGCEYSEPEILDELARRVGARRPARPAQPLRQRAQRRRSVPQLPRPHGPGQRVRGSPGGRIRPVRVLQRLARRPDAGRGLGSGIRVPPAPARAAQRRLRVPRVGDRPPRGTGIVEELGRIRCIVDTAAPVGAPA